jgi:membrane-bound lytic murein transglycosylase B
MSGRERKGFRNRGWRIPLALKALPATALLVVFSLFSSPLTSPAAPLPSGGFQGTPFGDYLAGRLVADGFDGATVNRLLADPRGEVLKTTLAYAIVYRETKADYSGFLSQKRLDRARAFLKRKKNVLREAEKQFQVPSEVTAAILMIESDFGNFRKLHRTFNVFATLLWAERPENFDAVSTVIRKRIPEVDDEKIRQRSRKKARWGYKQLVVLLQIAEREGEDPYLVEGSWAGAFGLPQFIPSSYWGYAVDGNKDRRVDLFNEDDAIFSIGNYLKTFGWREGLPEKKKKAVLRRYNNSGLYVDTVLAAAARLEKG